MTVTCKKCTEEFESKGKLNTHVLLNHPELARQNSSDYTSEVSDGHLNTEANAEKGESFGYRK